MTEDTAESRLAKTLFVVEATSFERHSLWSWNAANSLDRRAKTPINWEQPYSPSGWLVTVGHIGKRPCCISISWERLDGHMICFYEQVSQVTDSVKTEKWLAKHFKGTYSGGRPASCDAMNFAHCLHAIEEANSVDKGRAL